MSTTLHTGDCLAYMRTLPDDSVDAVVCDPPYGLNAKKIKAGPVLRAWVDGQAAEVGGGGFMGHTWDAWVPGPEVWAEALRVVKPGGHLIAASGTRTAHWLAVALELAGWEIRDSLQWLYWNGFPKNRSIDQGIDALLGAVREVVGTKLGRPGYAETENTGRMMPGSAGGKRSSSYLQITKPATDQAKVWEGWGTAVKPAHEPFILARKPIVERSIARQVLATGTGGLNIDGCRYALGDEAWPGPQKAQELGRFPANVYFCRKPNKKEKERGCDGLAVVSAADRVKRKAGSKGMDNPRAGAGRTSGGRNSHPTVKPVRLMRWLCRLVTPPGGVVLDPFLGSGTTAIAARLEGFRCIGVDLSPEYMAIARARIQHATEHPEQWTDTEPTNTTPVSWPPTPEPAAVVYVPEGANPLEDPC